MKSVSETGFIDDNTFFGRCQGETAEIFAMNRKEASERVLGVGCFELIAPDRTLSKVNDKLSWKSFGAGISQHPTPRLPDS